MAESTDIRMVAAVDRIQELKDALNSIKSELSCVEETIVATSRSFEEMTEQKNKEHDESILRAKDMWDKEHKADTELTEYFTSTANQQCLDTLISQNNSILADEMSKRYDEKIQLADQVIALKLNELQEKFDSRLAEYIGQDEERNLDLLRDDIHNSNQRINELKSKLLKP